MNPQIDELQKIIKYQYQDISFLDQALVHRSSLNEQRQFQESNERYEFLGDAVLELWISDRIFKRFSKFDEGKLTNLRALVVCTQNLAKVADSFKLGNFIYLSHGEENHGGLIPAFDFLDLFLTSSVEQLSSKEIYKDPKSIFQEIAQAKEGITPRYQTISESGPDHQKTFEVGVYLDDKLIATGSGNSKQKAEEDASIHAVEILKN